jgi:hypothetical protein
MKQNIQKQENENSWNGSQKYEKKKHMITS